MPLYTVDLHNHTPHVASDYKGPDATSAADLVRAASRAGIDVFGVTDHFSVGFFGEVERAAVKHSSRTGHPMLVVPGAEIKVVWGDDEAHMIALFPPATAEPRFRILMDALDTCLDTQPVNALPQLKVEADPVMVAGLVHELGGICHVAHVDRWFGPYRLMETALFGRIAAEARIGAVECVDPDACAWMSAPEHGYRVIASSDSHAPVEIGRRTTRMELAELSFEALHDAMRPWSRAAGS
jgi:PHP family Zn ribbon phosphoesterase